jgi:ferredoxin
MIVKKLDKASFSAWVDRLVKKQKVYGVKADGERFAFGPLSSASELRLDYDVTKLPPKKYFMPTQEVLVRINPERGFESVIEDEPFVLLGVHPYDVVAISQLDAAFTKDNYDAHYMTRRNNATIVACDVQNASANAFAGCMGTATVRDGFDVLLTQVDGGYIVDSRTAKGDALMKDIANAPAPSAADIAKREEVWKKAPEKLKKHELKCMPGDLPALLEKSEDSEVWDKKAEKCYSCGSCVLVCPTCYCFDVRDEANYDLKSGQRVRRWDGCMLSGFALVAGGHNFRKDRAARFRHRYYRKGKYLHDRMGFIACVGCGRCISACTTHIANPVEVYNELMEAK